MDNIESQIEDVSSDLKENKREQDETQKSLKQIESSIQKLSSDQAVVESLQKNRELKEEELAEVQEKNNELVNRITDIISTIKEEQASDGQSYGQLEGLESIGEDVSDAIAVLDEKNEFYEKCLETLSDLLDSNQILEKELREKMGLGETNSSSSEKQDYSRNDEDVLKSSNSINFDAEPGNYTYIETPTGKNEIQRHKFKQVVKIAVLMIKVDILLLIFLVELLLMLTLMHKIVMLTREICFV